MTVEERRIKRHQRSQWNMEGTAMRQIGIITLYHNNCNYGGALQAYALNQAVRELGYGCRTIDYVPTGMPLKEKLVRKIRTDGLTAAAAAAVKISSGKISARIGKAVDPEAAMEIRIRESNVAEFRKKRIPHTGPCTTEYITGAAEAFDMFLCGSDQIWNVGSVNSFDPVYWLDFVPDNRGKASYAASMPMPALPEQERCRVQGWLERLDFISVREEQGKKLLSNLTDKEIRIVPDPVFLPDAARWEEMAGERKIREPYFFAYLLGDDEKMRKDITELAEKYGRKLAAAPFLTSRPRKCDRDFGDIRVCGGPEDFLNMIRHADCVLTDSFHASVFSILFGTPFWAFRRGDPDGKRNMDSRLTHLTEAFGMADRLISTDDLEMKMRTAYQPDPESVMYIVEQERKRGRDYLKKILTSMEEKCRKEKEPYEGKSA